MNELVALASIVGALTIGVVSPGPSFVMVARLAVVTSRASGIGAATGMGVGGVVFASTALLGLQAVLSTVPSLYLGLKVVGGLYLCYLGARIFMAARAPLGVDVAGRRTDLSSSRAFWLGFTTQISNPKTAIVYASVFAAFLPNDFSPALGAALLCVVFAVETGWYSVVAVLLSSSRPRRAYLNCKAWVDRTAGLVLTGLGLKLIASAHKL